MAADHPTDQGAGAAGRKPGKCPICGKPAEPKYRPFCSQRCQQLDLGRWLGERYRIPAEQGPGDAPGMPGEDEE
jgi:endogenous inhibitor of DNA gyrase (YacG/DUF329 family)